MCIHYLLQEEMEGCKDNVSALSSRIQTEKNPRH